MSDVAVKDSLSMTHVHEIRSALQSILEQRTVSLQGYDQNFLSLWQTAVVTVTGGKLLRPRIFLGAYDALVASSTSIDAAHLNELGERTERHETLRVAAAIELLHYAFLLHDDVIDGDLVRRGELNFIGAVVSQQSASGTHKQKHWANSAAILVGDLFLTTALDIFARVDLPRPQRLEMLDLVDRAIAESIVGESVDVGLADGVIAPELATIIEMTRTKTATYTFELPLRLAHTMVSSLDTREAHRSTAIASTPAFAAGSEFQETVDEALTQLSMHLGIAFQVQDDLLSAFSEAEQHGKDFCSDFREGKETILIGYARTTPEWSVVAEFFGSGTVSPEDATQIRQVLEKSGAKASAESLLETHFAEAQRLIRVTPGIQSTLAASFLIELIHEIQGRVK